MRAVMSAGMVVLGLLAMAITMATGAEAACYPQSTWVDEQLVRLHSRLAVVALQCAPVRPDADLLQLYGQFGERHGAAVARAEGAVIAHLRAEGTGDPSGAFHALRTRFVNAESIRVTEFGRRDWCLHHQTIIDDLIAMDEGTMRGWLASLEGRMPSSRPMCR